jgi:hypothetical protein
VDYLFAESTACAVVSMAHDQWAAFRHIAERNGVPVQMLGRVGGGQLVINDWIAAPILQLRDVYEGALPKMMQERTMAAMA